MSNSSKIVIFDIDGTLANAQHRIHHVKPPEGQKKDWSSFFREAEDDEPFTHIVNLTKMYTTAGYRVCLCTGRPANYRSDTMDWLEKVGAKYEDLIMRLTTERGPDYVVKGASFLEFLKVNSLSLSQVEAVYEDRIQVAEMWRKMGIPVLLVGDEWRP